VYVLSFTDKKVHTHSMTQFAKDISVGISIQATNDALLFRKFTVEYVEVNEWLSTTQTTHHQNDLPLKAA